jgi:hypothetical protein
MTTEQQIAHIKSAVAQSLTTGNDDALKIVLARITEPPHEKWCAHISKSMSGIWCYSGVPLQGNSVEIGKWQYCPICGANRPNDESCGASDASAATTC